MIDRPGNKIKRITAVRNLNKPVAFSRLKEIAQLPDVYSIVALGDLGDPRTETPITVGIATKDIIYPQFCSNIVNCGICILKTDWHEEDVDESFFEHILEKITTDFNYCPLKITREELVDICLYGVEAIVKKHNLQKQILDRIENNGSMFDSPDNISIYESVPRWFFLLPSHRKIYFPNLGGNHFLEFQSVEDVVDETHAKNLGLVKGQIVLMLHTDYRFTSRLNWQYFPRLKMKDLSLYERLIYQSSKIAFQFINKQGVLKFSERWKLYFEDNNNYFKAVDTRSREGQRVVNALNVAMNYGYAARLAFFVYLKNLFSNLSDRPSNLELIWDVAHDSIQKEKINGKEYWIARKATSKVVPGKPAIVAGSYNMSSCLGIGLDGGDEYLKSYDHGSENVINHLEKTGKLGYTEDFTLKYKLGRNQSWDQVRKEKVRHRDSLPIKLLIDSLSTNNLVQPVVWLKPIVNLKMK